MSNIQEIIGAIKTSAGKQIDEMLPQVLKQNEFKTFFLDEKLLILKSERKKYTLLITIRHGFNSEKRFETYISKPEYYSDIHIGEDNRSDEANVYIRCINALVNDSVFGIRLTERLKNFDEQIIRLKEDDKAQDSSIIKLD